jgi:FKBP-type peptidyl-prolyl cis-trans isomerase SlyD
MSNTENNHQETKLETIFVVGKDTLVTLNVTVTDDQGNIVDNNSEVNYLHGGYNDIFPKIEAELDGKALQYEGTVDLAPAEAFEEHNPALVHVVEASQVPPDVQVGAALQSMTMSGPMNFRVTKIEDGKVTLDGNHPLAGKNLKFGFKVVGIRAATAEELAQRQPQDGGQPQGMPLDMILMQIMSDEQKTAIQTAHAELLVNAHKVAAAVGDDDPNMVHELQARVATIKELEASFPSLLTATDLQNVFPMLIDTAAEAVAMPQAATVEAKV